MLGKGGWGNWCIVCGVGEGRIDKERRGVSTRVDGSVYLARSVDLNLLFEFNEVSTSTFIFVHSFTCSH